MLPLCHCSIVRLCIPVPIPTLSWHSPDGSDDLHRDKIHVRCPVPARLEWTSHPYPGDQDPRASSRTPGMARPGPTIASSKSGQGDTGWLSNLLSILPVRTVAASCKTFLFGEQQQRKIAQAESSKFTSRSSSSCCVTLTPTSGKLTGHGRLICPESSVHLLTESSSTGALMDIVPLNAKEPRVRSILR